MSKFTLEITLGNAEMQDGDHIGQALTELGERFEREYAGFNLDTGEPYNGTVWDANGTVWDANGNRVGIWEVSE